MMSKDPNRFSWEGLYSWPEPPLGNRLQWKNDPWRLAKLSLIPLILFGIAFFKHIQISIRAVGWLTTISVGSMLYVWLWTFASRFIRLFEDRLSIRSPGGRGAGARNIFYSEIEAIEVAQKSPGYWITLKLKQKKPALILARNEIAVAHLQELFAASKEPNQLPQRNAGSRPSLSDSSASKTSSSLGPRG